MNLSVPSCACVLCLGVCLAVGCRSEHSAQAEPPPTVSLSDETPTPSPQPSVSAQQPSSGGAEHTPTAVSTVERDRYAWLDEWEGELPKMTRLEARFPAPKGFTRIALAPESFGTWLRGLPVRLDRTQVMSYRQEPLSSPAEAVVVLDVGERDLQQCADSALRLHAEFLWASGRAKEARYHFTSGDPSSWVRWVRGERFRPKGNTVEAVMGKRRAETHAVFRSYLQHLFRYAGTRSLQFDSTAVPVQEHLMPGDFMVQPGGPGHAVVILDVAQNASGERVALIGQGFMPAQEFHVVYGDARVAQDRVWFRLAPPGDPEATLSTPSWRPFERRDARRFK
ncbi:MAG: DUF4846 domain-containing protein [Myxococcota bacterium]